MIIRADKEEAIKVVKEILQYITIEDLSCRVGKGASAIYSWMRGRSRVCINDFNALKVILGKVSKK